VLAVAFIWAACRRPEEAAEREREHVIKFGQIYLSKPTFSEHEGDTNMIFPKEARLRNLT
jgi:DNA-directed RNA polymerase II subunit RPB2